ncbi:mesoderm induction early response protein 1-like isoform X3 [Eriocheir sinensis]|nr:mesoderm induction early response protein 1-like isoform X3 [Eriocheir sinensis]XP_050736746.1 mesoderm induction early response protein 1-like isoform X3 [Eriocheir sinensis]XP_050736754.1 mesoderm induction early response protein 1-like isoform X3 [Eriocheir sinensis]XP_050736758.1 mesoderm induction early response protein 1-like isoform X3 [Eriocheir sinensis]
MLVDDYDDERTLDEEEDMEEGPDREEEIDNLEKEQDMPIAELLAMYGGYPPEEGEAETEDQTNGEGEVNQGENENENSNDAVIEHEAEGENEADEQEEPEVISSRSSTSEDNVNNHEKEIKPEVKPERKRREKPSELAQLYADMDTNGDTQTSTSSRSLRCHKPLGILSTGSSRQQSEDEEEEEGEYSGEEEDWHKTIMIGSAYQAQVPEGLQAYGATPPYENEDKLLWEPGKLSPKQVEEYLRALSHPPPGSQGVAAIPLGKHVRDDEQALYLLLQCGYNVDEALRRHRMNPTPLASTMTLWSEEECRNFENGLKTYGKDFHLIQQNKVRTRSVGELVQFYYLWKKTERHDLFATKTRIEKKKYIVHPGTTDYMDRFLDEGEGVGGPASWRDNRSSSPSLHALLYGRPPPGNSAGPVGGLVERSSTPTSVAQPAQPNPSAETSGNSVNRDSSEAHVTYTGLNQMEDLARHLDADSIESLAKMTSGNSSVSIARTGKRNSSPHPMDVDISLSRSSVLSPQTIGVEAKSVAMTETVAQ